MKSCTTATIQIGADLTRTIDVYALTVSADQVETSEPLDLTGATILWRISKRLDLPADIELPATPLTDPTNQARIELRPADTATIKPGRYAETAEITLADGRTLIANCGPINLIPAPSPKIG